MDGRHRAYIGVGSNLGNRVENCRRAIEAVAASEDCVLEAQSPFYETEPVYLEDQDWFVNAAALIRTCLEAQDFLARLQAIEQKMGPRGESPRFGPRVLDLDILFFDDLVVQGDGLWVPHPRLHERRFVLKPLSDIAARFVHPVLGETVGSLLASLKDGEKKVLLLE